jgi:hypothetical protein
MFEIYLYFINWIKHVKCEFHLNLFKKVCMQMMFYDHNNVLFYWMLFYHTLAFPSFIPIIVNKIISVWYIYLVLRNDLFQQIKCWRLSTAQADLGARGMLDFPNVAQTQSNQPSLQFHCNFADFNACVGSLVSEIFIKYSLKKLIYYYSSVKDDYHNHYV